MTKLILVGGYVRKADDGGKAFVEEMIKGFEEPIKILDCMFARYKEVWNKKFEEDKEFYKAKLPDKNIELRLANPEEFIDQVKWADAIFLRGGSSEELVRALQENIEWTKYLDGKTVAGTSAGADALSKYYYGLDSLDVREGLGLVSVKVIPHFRADYHGWEFDWDRAYSDLENYKEELPILALAEGQFEVVEVQT